MAVNYETLSQEQQIAAEQFNSRQQEASADGGFHPRAAITDAEIEQNLNELDQAESQLNPQSTQNTGKIVEIRPGVMQENQQNAVESVANVEAGPRDFVAEQDATLKALEINNRLTNESSSILELSDAMTGLRPDTLAYQKLDSRLLDKLVSDELHITDAERAGDLLNLSLKKLENPGNSPEITARLDNTILKIFSNESADFNLDQLQQFSKIARERHQSDERYFDAFDAQAAKLVSESIAASTPSPSQPEAKANVISPLKPWEEQKPGMTNDEMEQARIDALHNGLKNLGATEEQTPEDQVAQPEVAAVNSQAELEAAQKLEQARLKELNDQIDELQRAWNKAPVTVRTGQSIDLRPLINVNGDARRYAEQLKQDINEGKREFEFLRVGGEQDDQARHERLIHELGKMQNLVERATSSSPSTSETLSKLDNALETSQKNLAAKLERYSETDPYAVELFKQSPQVKKQMAQMKKKPSLLEKFLKG